MKRKPLGKGLSALLPKKKGKIHAASMESPRCQRVFTFLSDLCEHSTREIIRKANVCAVNSVVDEIREHGYDIRCRRVADVWLYRMVA